MENSYTIVKEAYNGDKIYIDYTKLTGFRFTPRIKYKGIKVNSLLIVKQSFIEKLLKKKVKRKLDFYLNYIISLMDDEDDDGTDLKEALNDLERYKSIVEYKYRKYLEQKYINLLLKKIDIIEHELKMKIINIKEETYEMEERGKSR